MLLPVLNNPLYRRYMLGNGLSLLGLWVHRVGVGWLTWQLTESAFWLGAIAFADLFPAIIIGPFAGVWADRVDRVRLLIWTQASAAFFGLIIFALVATDLISVYLLLVLGLGLGISASVAQPARLALIPLLVRPTDMSSAVALGSVVFNTARFVGPMIAGAIIAWSEVSYAFLFNGVSYLIMLVALLGIPVGLHDTRSTVRSHILKDITDGMRYTLSHETIRVIIMIIGCVAVLGKPLAELLPGFADAVFGRGAMGLALMTQAMGVGALTGGIVLARMDVNRHLHSIIIAAMLFTGVLVACFGVVANFYLGLAVLFLAGMSMSATGICTQTLVQHAVREDMRGRVMSIWGLIFRGAPSIGVLLMGAGADLSSLGFVVIVAGVGCALVGVYGFRWHRALGLVFATRQPELAGGESAG